MRKATLAGVAGAEGPTARASSLSFRVRSALVAVSTLALAMVPDDWIEPAAAAPTNYSFTASAFGTSVTVGSVVESGPSAPISLGCTTENNVNVSNTTAGVESRPAGEDGRCHHDRPDLQLADPGHGHGVHQDSQPPRRSGPRERYQGRQFHDPGRERL